MTKFILILLLSLTLFFIGCMDVSYPMKVLEEHIPSSNNITVIGVGQPLRIMVKLTDEYSNLDKGMAIGTMYTPFTNLLYINCKIGQPDNQFYDFGTGVEFSNINGCPTFDFDLIPKKAFITNYMYLNISSGFWQYYKVFTLTVTNTN